MGYKTTSFLFIKCKPCLEKHPELRAKSTVSAQLTWTQSIRTKFIYISPINGAEKARMDFPATRTAKQMTNTNVAKS